MTSDNSNIIAMVEAMPFAAGEPVEAAKLAEIADVDLETMTKVLDHYGAMLDENGRGICLVRRFPRPRSRCWPLWPTISRSPKPLWNRCAG